MCVYACIGLFVQAYLCVFVCARLWRPEVNFVCYFSCAIHLLLIFLLDATAHVWRSKGTFRESASLPHPLPRNVGLGFELRMSGLAASTFTR